MTFASAKRRCEIRGFADVQYPTGSSPPRGRTEAGAYFAEDTKCELTGSTVTSIRIQRGVYQEAKYSEDGIAADEEEDGALNQLHPI